MPQAAVTAIAGYFAITGAVQLFLVKVFVYVATAYLLNRASKALAPKRRQAGLGTGTEINYFDTGAAVRIVYGQVKTGGMETIPPTTTSKDNSNAYEDLHKVLTLAGHEVDSYNFTHFDTTTIANADIAAMAYTTSDGMVTSGVYSGHAFIRRYRGTSTDSADRILTRISSTQFGNSRARGIAKAAITLRFNADIYQNTPTITFTYQGKRCYDPRLDSSPGAAPTNPSFIAWTQCPALCLADYLMSDLGGSYPAADIDWDTVVTAANYCDALVNLPNATTQKRYTCNGVLFANEEFTDNVKALADSMLGRVIFRDGKWRIFAGSWQTPTFTVLKEDWISGLSIRFEQGKKRRFNQMRTWFVDPLREWQRVESNPRVNATFKAADGGETLDAETEQLMCTNEYEAQRKGTFLLRQSRNQITVAGRLPPRFQNMALWDTGSIAFDHLGWTTKTFRVVGIDMNPDGSMDCVFSEEQSGDWTDPDAADYNAPDDSILPTPNPTTVTVFRGQNFFTSMVNCITSQVFSQGGAAFGPSVGRVDFTPAQLGNADGIVSITAALRAGKGNIFNRNNLQLRFVCGVSSVFDAISVPIGGTGADPQPITLLHTSTYTAGNSAFVALNWDVASGPNSFTFDSVSIRTEFARG